MHVEGQSDQGRVQLSGPERGDQALGQVLPQVETQLGEPVAQQRERAGQLLPQLVAYLEAAGTTEEELDEQFGTDARRSVKAGFVLDKLAQAEELGVDQNELSAYVTEQAYRMGVEPDRLAKELTDRGQLGSVVNDILRSKAMTLLSERAAIKDESGRTVDLAALRQAAQAAQAGAGDGGPDDAGE